LRWTISNSPCTASTDDVVITFNRAPTTSNAGPDQTVAASCGSASITLAGNVPSAGTGAWSIVSGAGGTITTPSSATSTFSGAHATTYTLRWTISNSPCTASTDDVVITISQYTASTDDQTLAGTDSWIGHAYDGINFSTYIGQFAESEAFVEIFGGDATCFNVISNSVTRGIYTETFSVKFRMNSTKKGLYVVNLGSDDGSRLTVDGTMVYSNWVGQGFSTKPSVLMSLNGASSLLYEYYEDAFSNQVRFNSLTLVLANTLSANTAQSLCVGDPGAAISGDVYGALPAGISLSGTGYQWSYSTTPGGARTNITDATGATFTPSASGAPFNAAGTYYIYRNAILSSTNNISPVPYVATNESDAAVITVSAAPSATISYSGTPFCSGAGTASVTRTGTAGGTYSSTAGLTINAATGTITPSSSTSGVYTVTYIIAASGACPAFTTTTNVEIRSIGTNGIEYTGGGAYGAICATAGEGNSATLTAPPGAVFTYVGFASYGTPGGTCPAFTIGVCHAANSRSVVENYLLGNNTASIPADNGVFGDPCYGVGKSLYVSATYGRSVCAGTSPGTLIGTAATGGDGTYIYLWEQSTTSGESGFSSAPGTNNEKDYTPGALAQTTWYRRTITSGGCSSVSIAIPIATTPAPAAAISYAGSPFCLDAGTTAAVTATGTTGGTYTSTNGLNINSVTGLITISSSTPGTYTVTYTIAAAGSCPQYQTTTSVTIAPNNWSGAVSTAWNVAGNWSCGTIPTGVTDVTIPGGVTNYPVLNSGVGTVRNITIQGNASVTVAGAILQVAGTISNSGIFYTSTATLEMNGSSAQTIPAAAFFGNALQSVTINNNAGVTLGGVLNITGVVTVAAGSLNTGGYLTLKSTATATASVGPITSASPTPITGTVIAERYVPGRRRYRLITSPVSTNASASLAGGQESMSIWGNWQNGGNNVMANTGTIITGGSSAGGFDPQTTNASLFTYNDVTRQFSPFTTANGKNTKYTSLKAGVAYYMFVYGDRINTITTSSPNNTTLSAAGTLLTGDQLYTTGTATPLSGVTGRYTLLGNPFASPINWATIPRTDIENTYWGWDPNLNKAGGYITVTTTGTVTLQAPFSGSTGLTQHIQSGQGFFVKTSGPSPSLTIREQDKVSTFNAAAFRGAVSEVNGVPLIAVNLQYASGSSKVLADGVLAAFDPAFSNTTGAEDAVKMNNSAENIAIINEATALSVNARRLPLNSDTLHLAVSGLSKPQYTLQVFTQQMQDKGLLVHLNDRYLNTTRLLSLTDTNSILFDVTPGIPASSDANRFRIVFHSMLTPLPVSYTSVQAVQKGNNIQVDWTMADERGIQKYAIEKSVDGNSFTKRGEVKGGGGSASYQWLDTSAVTGHNYYRIRAAHADGKSYLSKTVLVRMSGVESVISIFPNPVRNGKINVRAEQLQKGDYILQIHNPQGQQNVYRVIRHPGGKLNEVIYLAKWSAGMYYLTIGNEKDKYSKTFFIE
jgi:hypothetical protein